MKPIFLALGAMVAGLCGAVAAERMLSQDAIADFAWFQSLGYPDVKNTPWVEVWRSSDSTAEAPQAVVTQGFLLSSAGESFTVLRMDLRTMSIPKTAGYPGGRLKTGCRHIPFQSVAEDVLAGVVETQEDPSGWQRGTSFRIKSFRWEIARAKS